MDLLPERISPIRFYRLIETLFQGRRHRWGRRSREEGVNMKLRAWNKFREFFLSLYILPCDIFKYSYYLSRKQNIWYYLTNAQIIEEAKRQWISFYLPLVFFYRKKKNNRSKRRRGPFRSWCNLRNDKRWKKVSYNARCSPERTSLIFCLF